MHLLEKTIIAAAWIISFASILLIPREKSRDASFIFLLTQFPTWILGLSVVEFGWIQYPVRLFHEVNGTSISFEYTVMPFLCIFFNLYYPSNKSIHKKIYYYISILSIFTAIEYLAEKYTLILKYIYWHWYLTWISMFIVIYFVRAVYKWFFKLGKPLSL
jgi:hypothetical protein